MFFYLNGRYLQKNEAAIPLMEGGFQFGDGVFRTLALTDGKARFLKEQLDKLKSDCFRLRIEEPEINAECICEFISKNSASCGAYKLKIIISAQRSSRLNFASSSLIMMLDTFKLLRPPLKLTTYPSPVERPLAKVKSLSYADLLAVFDYAVEEGYHDAVTLSKENWILEGSKANLLFKNGQKLYFVDHSLPYLEGVTQNCFLSYAKTLGMQIEEIKIKPEDIPGSYQIYYSNSLQGILPVGELSGRKFSRDYFFEERVNQWIRNAGMA